MPIELTADDIADLTDSGVPRRMASTLAARGRRVLAKCRTANERERRERAIRAAWGEIAARKAERN